MKRKLSMSIQASDILNLREEIQSYIDAKIDSIHFDVMDHQYAGNFAFGPDMFQAIKSEFEGKIEIDVHFMITNPQSQIEEFIKLKPTTIVIDALSMPIDILKKNIAKIQNNNIKAGIAIQTKDNIDKYKDLIKNIDIIVFMSVPIGKSGQPFNEVVFENSKKLVTNYSFEGYIGIDGGVRLSNFERIVKSGFNFIVIGSILKGEKDYGKIIRKLNSY